MRIGDLISLSGNPRADLAGKPRIFVNTFAVVGSLVSIYLIASGTLDYYQWFAVFLFLSILALVRWSPFKSGKVSRLSLGIDASIMIIGCAALAYAVIDYPDIRFRAVSPTKLDIGLGILLILSLLELSRRVNGIVLPLITLFFFFYVFMGPLFPGIFAHKGYSIQRVIGYQFLTGEGIFGVPTQICATIIVVFVIFGALLKWTRATDFIHDVAFGLTGRAIGGPAKVATLASAGFGMVSGSAAANVATTGQFTIPLMKRAGFAPHMAGAVEAAASSGGQIMPPIMGAGVFIMATLIEMPYPKLMIAGIIPALIYFFAVYWAVHFYAISQNIKPVPSDMALPSIKDSFKWGWVFILPIAVLLYLILIYYPLGKAVIFTMLLIIASSTILARTRLNLKRLLSALEEGFTEMVPITAACACASMITGIIALTGIGVKIGTAIVGIAGGNLFLVLMFSMAFTIILGMGLPTTACYIVAAAVIAPVLIGMELTPLVAHFFVFIFAVFSGLTPPVAIVAFIGAGLANADQLKTAFTSMLIGCVAYLLPFLFAYDDSFLVLLLGKFSLEGLFIIATAFLGFFILPAGVMGALKVKTTNGERLLLLAGGFCLIMLSHILSLVGLILTGIAFFLHMRRIKKF